MKKYLVFNGDTDGICAALQYYRRYPTDYIKITGVKRDIALLSQIADEEEVEIAVFDISIDKNWKNLKQLLENNCWMVWFDHHISKMTPKYPNIDYHVQTDSDVNTSLIVARFLKEPLSRWAIVGLFGDNMTQTALNMADSIGLDEKRTQKLEQLGVLLNYNAYGATLEDLHFHPADVLDRMKPYDEPFEFLRWDPIVDELLEKYEEDRKNLDHVEWLSPNIVLLPDESWARRVIGDFAHRLSQDKPDECFAVLLSSGDHYQVSVRTPADGKWNAGEFCLQFPTGGGRVTAAGINQLSRDDLSRFIDKFNRFST